MTGLERKITTDFVHDFVRGMMTVAEYIERREFADAVQKIPETTPEIPMRDSGYIGKHEQNVSVYDAMIEEIHADKAIRAEKFRKTHDLCKKSKNDTPADRKRNKLNRLRKMYGDVWEDGREWYYENGKTGSKKSTEKDAEILRNLKVKEQERSAYADMIPDAERHVGFNAVQRIMYNADKRMREIRAEMCAYRDDDEVVETYDDSYVVIYADGMGYQHPYPDEYYFEKSTWEFYYYLIEKYGMDYANKYAKGECY